MIINKFFTMASAVISIICLSPQHLLAGSFGPFDYTVHENAVTIDYYRDVSGGPAVAIVIPASIEGKPVTAIGSNAFNSCGKVTSLSIPSSVTSIGNSAFIFCDGLTTINIPEGVKTIEDYSFNGCKKLTKIDLTAGLTRIAKNAFSSCSSLEHIVIPEGVTEISAEAFSSSALKKAIIPSSVKTLGDYAFSNTDIRSIVIPDTVEVMGKGLFSACPNLKQVDFPAHFKSIPERMFFNSGLTRITIPPTVTQIGNGAFAGCRKVATVTIPATVKTIGNNSFESCGNLESALFMGKAPEMGKLVFNNTAPDFRIIIAGETNGYTVPRWYGYRTGLPNAEIAIQNIDGQSLTNGAETSRYGDLIVGQSSSPKRFLILNVGARILTGLHVRTSGGESSDFIIKPVSKSSLAPGKTAVVEISFVPKKKGKRISQLRISSSDADENPFEIKLSGRGLELLK